MRSDLNDGAAVQAEAASKVEEEEEAEEEEAEAAACVRLTARAFSLVTQKNTYNLSKPTFGNEMTIFESTLKPG